ncbi:VirK family protein [Rhizobium nepotum]
MCFLTAPSLFADQHFTIDRDGKPILQFLPLPNPVGR